jgi:molybdate transport system substrate-binding protein
MGIRPDRRISTTADGRQSRYLGMQRRAVLAGLAVLAAAAAARPARSESGAVTVFAAASLKNALDAIVAKWQAESGDSVTISYAASSTLAKQIENGAPAGLFLSADLDWMDYLDQHQLIDPATRYNLLGNQLVLIAPKDSKVQTAIAPGFALAGLLGDGRLAMADPAAVPAGRYGKAALTALGVWDMVAGRVAAAENARAALLLVARGEAPLGIVYRTDAVAEPAVRVVAAFPPGSHPPIIYPIALTKTAGPAAAKFAAYLRSTEARELFEAQGFTVLGSER